jgi:fermentation-respiration switch protein FrsA (DUF1100 family)
MVAAQDQRIAALVVDGAYPRLSGLLMGYLRAQNIPTRLLTTALAWLTLVVGSLRTRYLIYRANPVDLADRIKAPALFIHGDLDPFVTPAEVETVIARLSGKTELWRVPDAGHREAYSKHPDEYNRRVVAWFEQSLIYSRVGHKLQDIENRFDLTQRTTIEKVEQHNQVPGV